jgi:STE24 endopeptidase
MIPWLVGGAVVFRWLAQLGLERLNARHVRAQAEGVPAAFQGAVDEATYARSVNYTLARGRFSQLQDGFDAAVLLLVVFSGVLPWGLAQFTAGVGSGVWTMAGFIFAVGLVLAAAGLPLSWWEQFRLEQRFGFNTTTQPTWWLDRLKGLLLSLLLGYPLLVLTLALVAWVGSAWWLWAWGAFLGFQFLMMVLAPVLILPLFNRFTPLPEGSLKERLLALAERTRFRAHGIQVMDGSKRTRHSNAFFTGLGRFRKIVLFDTLIGQLSEAELEAVLAHEIGHYKLRHILKMLAGSALCTLAGFAALAWLAKQTWFYQAFGFAPGNVTPALLLFGLLAGVATFWLSPLFHAWSRRYEYQADAYAARTLNTAQPLIGALRKLHAKNLSNLTPHPLYSGFHYSHPTLLEREEALGKVAV